MRRTTQTLIVLAAFALCSTLFTGCSAKARMARHQRRADTYFAAGDLSKAEVEYLIALRLDRANVHNISRLGEIYYEQGRFRPAYSYIAKAVELTPDDIGMRVKLGTIYLNLHAKKEAAEQAALILDKSPTNAEAPDLLAESISSRTELEQAQKRLEKLSKQIGETAPVDLGIGILDFTAGNAKDAETVLKRALALNPKYASAYYCLGNLYVAQNKMTDADTAFKTAADLSPARSPLRLSYANFKIQTGDLAEGKRLMDEITKQVPDYVPAWIREAEIALAEKRFDDCNNLINQALARDTDNYEALLLRGRMYLAQKQGDKAVAEMDRMSSLYDRSPAVMYFLALAHASVNDPVKASADLSKALFLQPNYPEATILLAEINLNKGDAGSAITSLSELVRQKTPLPDAYLVLASAYRVQQNPDQALSVYNKMASMFPKNPQVPFLAGMLLMQQNHSAEARKAFEKALELAPKAPIVVAQLVDLDIAENQFTPALDTIQKELNDQSGIDAQLFSAKVHMARAKYLALQDPVNKGLASPKLDVPAAREDVNQAETLLIKAVAEEPNAPMSYIMLSQLYVATGKEQAALDRLNTLVSKTNNVAAYLQIGMIYDAKTNYPAARDAYEKLLALNPDFVPALNNLAYLYSEHLNDLDKAYTLAEKCRQLAPQDPTIADTLGWILYKKGDYARALPLVSDSASKLSGQPEVQLHLGLVQYMLGNENAARAALQQAANAPGDFAGKEQAARHLAILAIDSKTADAKARGDLEKRLQDEPNDPVATVRLATIYEREGSLDKAAKIYEQALKQNPQNAQMMGHLATIYITLKNPDKAMDLAKDAHKLAPNDAAISCTLGRLVFQSGDYNWAASLLQDAAPKLPNQPEVQYDLARSYYSVGRAGDAEKTMQSAVPGLTGATLDDAKQFLAMVAAAKTPTPAAAAQAAQILSTDADYVPALMVSAVQAEKQGKPEDAKNFYDKALARYPAFTPAARNLVILSARYPGDDQRVYDLGVKARAAFPDDSELARSLGILAYRRGDYARAAQLLQESSQKLNQDGETLYYLGMAHYQLKQKSVSKTELQRALGLNLNSKLADDARKALAELK
ncbi:MAG TPA: tetratricopeptide repeat protein [Verrucomicrobiae bacterium]|jgi:tetratricopeptide (TPR) repeat protein|nr:tetratricopeptide repeat protein [Verrucomicrobiae bacterium]